jgi:hypothetical protein
MSSIAGTVSDSDWPLRHANSRIPGTARIFRGEANFSASHTRERQMERDAVPRSGS